MVNTRNAVAAIALVAALSAAPSASAAGVTRDGGWFASLERFAARVAAVVGIDISPDKDDGRADIDGNG